MISSKPNNIDDSHENIQLLSVNLHIFTLTIHKGYKVYL